MYLKTVEKLLTDPLKVLKFYIAFPVYAILQVLEETSGLTLGSSSGGSDSDVSFKPQQGDLSEFIKQSNQCGISQVCAR